MQCRGKQPALPQRSSSYLRIKYIYIFFSLLKNWIFLNFLFWVLFASACFEIFRCNLLWLKFWSLSRDGRMTVRLLIKYLVKKLGLDSESEVFININFFIFLLLTSFIHTYIQLIIFLIIFSEKNGFFSPFFFSYPEIKLTQHDRNSTTKKCVCVFIYIFLSWV